MTVPPKSTFAVFAFSTTHDALDAEALLEDMGIDVVPIPAPPTVSAHCGIALRLAVADVQQALIYLARVGIEVVAQGVIDDV